MDKEITMTTEEKVWDTMTDLTADMITTNDAKYKDLLETNKRLEQANKRKEYIIVGMFCLTVLTGVYYEWSFKKWLAEGNINKYEVQQGEGYNNINWGSQGNVNNGLIDEKSKESMVLENEDLGKNNSDVVSST